MSTLAYAALTTRREESPVGQSTTGAPPGVKTYVDALAALVPAEVLTLHALILSFTTTIQHAPDGTSITTITDRPTLYWSFFGLLALSVLLYAIARVGKWDRLDFLRAGIPPLAFVGWTMLQRATAFDAVAPLLGAGPRAAIGLFLGALLGLAAAGLAIRADQKQPAPRAQKPPPRS